ncbi:5,6-dimethylbenzimidazole synthase [Gammaproteobacteria bacterium]|nr:5,6-dimethylbenzimidazole synthase [Gammaproteobacteria bacterium]
MDIYEALYTTRAMRRLKPDPIPYAVQARILDAAIRAPNMDQQWRFLLVDDTDIKSQLAPLYLKAWERLFEQFGISPAALAEMMKADTSQGRSARSGDYLAHHFAEVPLLLMGFSRVRGGSSIDQALWSAMLAARADGVGSVWTGVLQTSFADEACAILGVPTDAGWFMQGVIPMGYPLGKWRVAQRRPAHEVAARNSWQGDLGFTVLEPLWPK